MPKDSEEECFPDHKRELNRLNRIEGQLRGIRKMVEERRYCPEILIQTCAVKSAIQSLEASMLEKHINHCVRQAFGSNNSTHADEKIAELINLFRKNA